METMTRLAPIVTGLFLFIPNIIITIARLHAQRNSYSEVEPVYFKRTISIVAKYTTINGKAIVCAHSGNYPSRSSGYLLSKNSDSFPETKMVEIIPIAKEKSACGIC